MRQLRHILIISIFFSVKAIAQDSAVFKSYNLPLLEDTVITGLERDIVSDSVKYELRLQICNFFYPNKLIQITKDFNDNWSYRLGYYKYIDNHETFVFQDSIVKKIDWGQFEIQLDSFINAKIPNQYEIELKFNKDGKMYKVNNGSFFSTIMDGVSYIIEIYDNKNHEVIYYTNPHSYLEDLMKNGLPTKEHEDFIKFIDYLTETFDFHKLQMIQINDGRDTKDKKKRRRKRR